jgi:ABC-type uncharacterized transport system ATPase component
MRTLTVVNGKLVIETDKIERLNKKQYARRVARFRQRVAQADDKIAEIQEVRSKVQLILDEYLVHESEMS